MSEPVYYRCSMCGAEAPSHEMLAYGNSHICSRCKPRYAQELREGVTSDEGDKIPLFPKIMIIVDLAFCVLRAPLILLGLLGAVVLMKQGNQDQMTAVALEVGTGTAILLFGLTANIMMLLKKKIGALFAGLNILATMASIGVGIVQAIASLDKFEPGTPERIGGLVGGIGAVLIRIVILIAYCIAVWVFWRWRTEQEAAPGRSLT